MGKSTLLSQFINLAKQQNDDAIVVTSNDRHTSPAQVMGHIAAELAKLGFSHSQFDDRYKKYRELREEIESDPNAPPGIIDLLARVGSDVVFKSARHIPGAAPLLDSIDQKATSDALAQLAKFGFSKWSNKDEKILLLETEQILTPLFINLLKKVFEKRPLVLMFDVFERTSQSLSRWLLQLFNFEYGEFDTTLTFVIAGRDPLEQHWTGLTGGICHIALEPFTLEETQLYLVNQGITDDSLIMQIYEDTGGLPVLVELLAATKPQPGAPLADVSKDAVERFLQWVSQEDRRRIALLAAVPRQFNRDILTSALGSDATDTFDWLATQSFVRADKERGWFYHEKVRELMLRHLHNTTPKDLEEAHSRLANYFVNEQVALNLVDRAAYNSEAWRKAECERIYHLVSTQPEIYKGEALNAFFHAFHFRWGFARSITSVSKQVSRERNVKALAELATVAIDFYSAYDSDDYQAGIDALNILEKYGGFTVIAKCSIYSHRGYLYSNIDNQDQALKDLTQAIEVDQKCYKAVTRRGHAYLSMDRYEEALADFNKAIELDGTASSTLVSRGSTYELMERYEDALADFSRAIEIDGKSVSALLHRSLWYQRLRRHDEALVDINRAIEIDKNNTIIFSSRGLLLAVMGKDKDALADLNRAIEFDQESTLPLIARGIGYGILGEYEKSLEDCDRAIEIGESLALAFMIRGKAHQSLEKHEEAVADFSRAINLDSKSAELVIMRGDSKASIDRYEEALADFTQAMELDGESAVVAMKRGITYWCLDRYNEALDDFTRVINLDETFIDAFVKRGTIYRLMDRYEEAITDFSQAIKLNKKNARAIAGLALTYQMMGRYKQALSEFSRAIEFDKQYIPAIESRGETYRLLDKHEKAILNRTKQHWYSTGSGSDRAPCKEGVSMGAPGRYRSRYCTAACTNVACSDLDFDRVLEINEKNAYVLAKRGATYHHLGMYEKALADLNRAIEIDEEFAWAIARRGEIFRDMGRFDSALADLNMAIELDPTLIIATRNCGVTYRLMGRLDEALEAFDKVIKSAKDNKSEKDETALAWRGEIKRRLGRYEEAINDLSSVIKDDKRDTFALSRRAAAYLASGKAGAARRDFQLLMSSTPKTVEEYYNRGVTFAIFNRHSDAIRILKEAFKLGNRAYFYAITDDLLEPLRRLPEFQNLINDMLQTIGAEEDR